MEVSLASTCTPLNFNSKLKKNHAIFHSQISTLKVSTKHRTTKKPFSIVNAINPNRQTLSSNWLVSNDLSATTTSPRLPKFEELDTTNMLLRQRIVFLGSQVDDMTADFVISQLLFLDAEDSKKDIKLFINSPGGSVTAGMGIYDAMKLCKADVSTVCLGLAASMGAFILAAGTKGKRYCMPNSRVMIHQPLGSVGGIICGINVVATQWLTKRREKKEQRNEEKTKSSKPQKEENEEEEQRTTEKRNKTQRKKRTKKRNSTAFLLPAFLMTLLMMKMICF